MSSLGKPIILVGLILVLLGLLLQVAPSIPFLGRLPGDSP